MSEDFMEGVDFDIKPKGIIQRAFKEEMLSFEYLDEVMVSNFLALQNKLIVEITKEFEYQWGKGGKHIVDLYPVMTKLIGEE